MEPVSTHDPVGVAVIGAGNWGKNHVRTFAGLAGGRLLYCCDLSQDRLDPIAAQFPSVKTVTDFQAVLGDPRVKAVVVAIPGVHHFKLAREALLAGKDLLVEKPLCLQSAHAEELVDLARREGRILMVGHLLLYHPAVRKLKEIFDSGELGKVYYAYSQRVNLGTIRQDESALWSFAPHDISVLLYLLEDVPVKVSANGASYITPGQEDVVFLSIEFPNGVIAHIHMSWLDPHKIRRMTFVGSKRMVVFDDADPAEKIRIFDKGVSRSEFETFGEFVSLRQGDVNIPYIKMQEPLRLQALHFLECVKERREPRSSGQQGLDVVRIIEAADASLKSGGQPRLLSPATIP